MVRAMNPVIPRPAGGTLATDAAYVAQALAERLLPLLCDVPDDRLSRCLRADAIGSASSITGFVGTHSA
jgi:hypothetical protein